MREDSFLIYQVGLGIPSRSFTLMKALNSNSSDVEPGAFADQPGE